MTLPLALRVGALVASAALVGCGTANGASQSVEDPTCSTHDGVAIQVLGAGGPIAESDRAGTSYLLWVDGQARLQLDAGSGSFLRFAQAGGSIASLDAVLLTHLHADHVGDLIDVLNTGGFERRTQPLKIIGPDSADRFPGTSTFLQRLIGKETGAFSYNGGYLDGSEGKALLVPEEVETRFGQGAPVDFLLSDEITVTAHPVHHGVVPALGYRISVRGKTIIVTGDQSGMSEGFATAFTGSKPDILIAHHVINGQRGQPRGLHRTPAEIGELAGELQPRKLVLTHNMERSLSRIDEARTAIGESYRGDVSVAFDLDCLKL